MNKPYADYRTDSRCTWRAIGVCSECGRVRDGGVPAAAAPDLRGVLIVLERLLPQHKADSMRGQIEDAIEALRTAVGVEGQKHG